MRSWRRKKQKPNSSRSGAEAERRVRRFYRLRGYRILGANVRAGGNELDIVLRRGRRLVVCEVKARTGPGYGDPWEAVGREKERRLRRAAESWLARHPELRELEVACEVVAVRGRRIERVPLG
jgi:putative endonuclease